MNRARPTCPKGVTCQPIGTAARTRRNGTASGAPAPRRAVPAAARATNAHHADQLEGPDDPGVDELLGELGAGRLFGCRQSVHLVHEQARADPDQRLPCRVEEDEQCECDPADACRDAPDAAEQHVHHRCHEGDEHQGRHVHAHPRGHVVGHDGVEVLALAGRVEEEEHRPGQRDANQEGDFCAAGTPMLHSRASVLRPHARVHTAGARVRQVDQRTLARTGVHVSPLCLGAMMFGAWGETDHDESIRIIHRALDAGINFIDTADVYARGESEEIVGKALAGGRRDDVVLATKFHGTMGDDVNEAGNSRRWIFREVEASLKRLGTDWIDLYQVHRWDPWTDHDETLGALSDLVAQGKVRYIGSSTYPAAQIVEGAVGRARARPAALRLRAAALLDPRARDRGRRAADVPGARHGRDPLEPARRRLAVGTLAQGRRRPDVAARRR